MNTRSEAGPLSVRIRAWLRRRRRDRGETVPFSPETGIPAHCADDGEVVLRAPRLRLGASTWGLISASGFLLALATALVVLATQRSLFWVVWAAALLAISIPPLPHITARLIGLVNPRPRLVADRGAVPAGETVRLRWAFRRKVSRFRSLSIWLEGREESVDAGSRSHANVFAKVPIAEATDPRRIATGAAAAPVPTGLMHSFEAGRNRIVWRIRVHGDVKHRPNLDLAFPFVILPEPAEEAAG